MAKLLDKPYPMPEWKSGDNTDEYFKQSEAALNAIPLEKLYFESVADGNAYYYVVSEKPLILQHVPYMDAWQLPAAHIRRLRLSDVRKMIESNIVLNKLFGS